MEETRISRMYANLFVRSVRNRLPNSGRGGGPGLTIAAIAVVLLVFWGLYEGRGYLRPSTWRSRLSQGPARPEAPTPKPGGQEPLVLTRGGSTLGATPEFVSATVLPGRGMNVLQLVANVPGLGEVPLLVSPGVEDAAAAMTGEGHDESGALSTEMGGALMAPWANRMWGTRGIDGKSVTVEWRGRKLSVPTRGSTASLAGLMLGRAADTSDVSVMPDGGQAEGVFQPGDFEGRWPSQTELKVTVLLSSRTLELTVVARNTGSEPEPMGIGWHPRFAVAPGGRAQMILRMPRGLRAEVRDRTSGQPSGRLLPVDNTPYDFTGKGGRRLDGMNLDDSFVHLMPALLDNGPVAELRDPARNIGLRLTALSPLIKAMRVDAPARGDYVSIEPQFNYDDPLGKEWGNEDTGMVTLQPGQSVQWKVRLELFSLTGQAPERGRLGVR